MQISRQNSLSKRDTVVIIGAGPVGLWVSCQIKLQNPDLRVVVSEKRAVYVREEMLNIKESSLATQFIQSKEFQDVKQKIQGRVVTKEVEAALSYFAQKMGVMIVKGEGMQSIQDVFKLVKEESIVALIGCDGLKSQVRQKVMKQYKQGEQLTAFKQIQYSNTSATNMRNKEHAHNLFLKNAQIDEEMNIVKEHVFFHQLVLKYKVEGKAQPLSKLDFYNTQKLLRYSVTEMIEKYNEKNDQTDVTCIFILDHQAAQMVKHFTEHKPGKFFDIENKRDIQDCINVWMNAKREFVKQEIVEKSEKFIYIPISVYCACDFIDLNYSFPIALAGEAAFGVPYFKSLNQGLESGTRLVEQLSDYISKKSDVQKSFEGYQKYMVNKVLELFMKASQKSKKFEFGLSSMKMNNNVPWEFIKWHDGEFKKRLYKKFDPHHEHHHQFQIQQDHKPYEYGIDESELPYFLRSGHR